MLIVDMYKFSFCMIKSLIRIRPLSYPETIIVMTTNDMLTRQEAVDYLRINQSTLFRWEKKGKIRRTGGIGKKVYYSRAALDRAIINNK